MARHNKLPNGTTLHPAMAPPPSTIAAQIVQNQTQLAPSDSRGETTTFAQLLHEILHNHAARPETDLGTNVKLISVVAEAGLGPLAENNPFNVNSDVLLSQAKDSIAVIRATIERQPAVLVSPVKPNGPQLILPLLTKLISLCGNQACEELPIVPLLTAICDSLGRWPDFWALAGVVPQVLQDCVDDILAALESFRTTFSLLLKVPPLRSVTRLWPESENAITVASDCQATIGTSTHAFMLALKFSAVADLSQSWRRDAGIRLQRLFLDSRPKLGLSQQCSGRALIQLLSSSANPELLIECCRGTLENLPDPEIQDSIAIAITTLLRSNSTDIKDILLECLAKILSDPKFAVATDVFRVAIIAAVRYLKNDDVSFGTDFSTILQDLTETDKSNVVATTASFGKNVAGSTSLGKRKRPNRDETQDSRLSLVRQVSRLLTRHESDDFHSLARVSAETFLCLDEDKQITVWRLLRRYAENEHNIILNLAAKLAGAKNSHQSSRVRIHALITLQSCLQKSSDESYLDLQTTPLGQYCLTCLRSSIREIRIAAAQCLPAFLRADLPAELVSRNRRCAMEYLRMLSERETLSEHETLVSAWAIVGSACGEKELNLVLLRLIEYLGHSNPLISGLAFVEIENLAAKSDLTVDELCRPFWSSIAVSVVRDLQSRPQKAQQICDLLGTDINKFLILTQEHTVPSLVLSKKLDVLQRIATARGKAVTIQDVCLQPKTNLAAIMAALLIQYGYKATDAYNPFREVAPDLGDTDIVYMMKLEPMLIASDILKFIGDDPELCRAKGHQALGVLATIAERGSNHVKAHPKASRYIAEFFASHILGIITNFSQTIEDAQGVQPESEKLLCVRAIAEMIFLAKQEVSSALPQFRSCLSSAMDNPALCETAFSAWLSLLSVLNGEDIGHVVDQTFALILRHWSKLSPNLQQVTHEKIAELIQNHNQVMQDNIMTVPNLGEIPLLSKFAAEIERLRTQQDVPSHFKAFTHRLRDESKTVVVRAVQELVPFLEVNQGFLHDAAISEQPAAILPDLVRALLDAAAKYCPEDGEVADAFGKVLGIVGCLDPNRVETVRKKKPKFILSNFETASEVIDWALVFLEDVLVKVFKSVSNPRAQGFVAYVIQELLRFCGINDPNALHPRTSQGVPTASQRFSDLPEHVRITLTPLISSRYFVTTGNLSAPNRAYPGFLATVEHATWLRQLVFDLLWKAKGENAQMVFPLLARLIRGHDVTIATFILPYAAMNVVLGGTVAEAKGISDELLAILKYQPTNTAEHETVKLCSESVFAILDYMSAWLREKKKVLSETRTYAIRAGHSPDFDESKDMGQISTVENFLATVPAKLISTRAAMCGSYARALLHWEQHVRHERPLIPSLRPFQRNTKDSSFYDQLQHVYAQIDEPDGLEGISAHLTFLSEDQQAIQNAKAGRWTAAQTWYEIQLSNDPGNIDIEEKLLSCLRETGRYEPLLRYANAFSDNFKSHDSTILHQETSRLLPVTLEAYWMTGNSEAMRRCVDLANKTSVTTDFNTGVATIIQAIRRSDRETSSQTISRLRKHTTQSMTTASTSSIQASREDLRKLHVLYEIEILCNGATSATTLDKRLAALGSYVSDKQFVLGVRRAIMGAQNDPDRASIGSSWLTTAKLARQTDNTESAYNAVLRASECGIHAAKLEEARLLWRDGHQRHAIQALEGTIYSGILDIVESGAQDTSNESQTPHRQNTLSSKAHLLLAKWLDATGQRQAKDMTEKYQYAARHFQRWEKGHYYLGKHYQKLLEAEKALPKNKQTPMYLSGDFTRLVIENQTRSIAFGNKYWHQTIPKIFTLWLDLGSECMTKQKGEDSSIADKRHKCLQSVNKQFVKYFDRVPPYVFYSALPQLISRITHPHPDVWKILSNLLVKIVTSYPQQALWSILAVIKATDRQRVEKGIDILTRAKDPKNKTKSSASSTDLRIFIAQAQRLTDGLLNACEEQVKERVREVSLSKDLGFNHKLAPSQLVVPIELTLTANGPTNATLETIRQHKPFVQDKITINAFVDEVMVLSSLQRPRKVTVRGSDGKNYGLLCKPRDDLRKDQRLMEFNGVINRALKRDSESSKRRLYIKTYAVTPLSEESGTIEWVEGIKPLRDILLSIYARKAIRPNYQEIRDLLHEAASNPGNLHLFTDKVLGMFPASLHEWFVEVYTEPDSWFAARLRYARSAAVTSMSGHVLGLGDRHGENILLEEGTGGVFHVDFNCLFDKGLTFEKPELVPFRLTHNMVDAMGPYGYEGPYRKSCELTLRLLRQSRDTLMTVLETFLYDPTTDFVGKKKRSTVGVPDTPQEILDSVESKLKGLLRDETVPLSVEGYVDALIRQATDHHNLASMYIGWCAFL